MKIIESIQTKNPCYKAGRKIKVKGLMLHSIGCPQPNATVFVKRWNSEDYTRACVHGFIDARDGTVYQTLPWDHRGWHGGGSSNNTHIGVEMCEPDCIEYTGGSSFVCSDVERARVMVKRTYEVAVQLYAYLCKMFKLDPLEDGVIISHKEGHKRGIASNHGDPEHLWRQLNMGYTMDTFRQAVRAAMGCDYSGVEITPGTEEKTTEKEEATVNIELNVLKNGAKGEQVKTLQRLLLAFGYKMTSASGKTVYGVDGSFGGATERAVRAYQEANGLSVDGVVGKNTWAKLLKG